MTVDFHKLIAELQEEIDIHRKNEILAYAFLKAEEDGLGRFLPSFFAHEGKNVEAAESVKRHFDEYVASNYGPVDDAFVMTYEVEP
ncbi:hypothetical protein ABZS66_36325 [Dactylosporangium sp. NPDC005572]|uniref:hypothetical protein n=1 Tax=Dactylosporangium sp. NPDC005572 TaxID=3156889 RepID=UPI0033AE076A